MDELEWTCMVCGDLRPDARISVHSGQRDFGHGVVAQVNVRYCNDKQECRDGANDHTLLKPESE